ncbi:hypothetical protein [Aquisediminimonas sediminicola]|uniref:hypothetical protein n=1 Tax=Alteraquisediminimonas sediminicola TaxID=2676787 RepID=UPI001C8D46F3
MDHHTTSSEIVAAVTKASPPIAVVAATLGGLSLQDWVLATTLFYTVLQIILLIRRTLKGKA